MGAKPAHDSPSRLSSMHRIRFPRSTKHLDMEHAKVALDLIIRPSLQLWKLALGPSGLTALKRPKKTVLLCDDTSSTSSTTLKKKVRFDEKPVTISRKTFHVRCRKDSNSSPARPCLVMRDSTESYEKPPERTPEPDARSVYEDCLADDPGFLTDLCVLDGDAHVDTRRTKRSRRSEFYEVESGIAMFDQTGYANHCLSRWLDKKREAARTPRKWVCEDPALSRPHRTLAPPPPPSNPNTLDAGRPVHLAASIRRCRSLQSLPWRIYTYVEDELQNAVAVLVIGLFIHICLFLFLVYDILTRGLIPSDD